MSPKTLALNDQLRYRWIQVEKKSIEKPNLAAGNWPLEAVRKLPLVLFLRLRSWNRCQSREPSWIEFGLRWVWAFERLSWWHFYWSILILKAVVKKGYDAFSFRKTSAWKTGKNGDTVLWSLRKELDFWKWRELPQPKPLKTGTFEQVWCWFLG